MDQPQATTVKLHLGLTLGVSYIGIVFSSMLYGLTCLQTFIYFVSAPRDPWLVKAFVVLTLIIDSTHEAFIVHSGYYYSVLNFNNPAVFDHVVWSLLAFIFLNALSGLLTEGFILWRIYHSTSLDFTRLPTLRPFDEYIRPRNHFTDFLNFIATLRPPCA
ncbi:hypothetical protein FA95DRAFT_1559640 [Auriscalpium vulgare]|uniref:Uncharacterized protein n=1 Tax=Auriscalpium vulgare TaxID=40419 RepID=A0ACB8RTF7_9AGAM|nr:hypothetical protein FA95DRAFT_1559640 [Auriscalpium vulgare]